jgi:hypothetical protein
MIVSGWHSGPVSAHGKYGPIPFISSPRTRSLADVLNSFPPLVCRSREAAVEGEVKEMGTYGIRVEIMGSVHGASVQKLMTNGAFANVGANAALSQTRCDRPSVPAWR